MTATDITQAEAAHHATPQTPVAAILLSVLVFLAGWATSVVLWGIPGLYIPALAMVPVIWVVLLIISKG